MARYSTTPERRANLVKLARFLFTEPIEEQFNMISFFHGEDGTDNAGCSVKLQGCETAGCAVGWAPNAGIPFREHEDWESYCGRNFIDVDDEESEWDWCFDANWRDGDNTPKGAAKRILWLLLHGVPDDDYSQRCGEVPLCYADWQPTEADWAAAEVSP